MDDAFTRVMADARAMVPHVARAIRKRAREDAAASGPFCKITEKSGLVVAHGTGQTSRPGVVTDDLTAVLVRSGTTRRVVPVFRAKRRKRFSRV